MAGNQAAPCVSSKLCVLLFTCDMCVRAQCLCHQPACVCLVLPLYARVFRWWQWHVAAKTQQRLVLARAAARLRQRLVVGVWWAWLERVEQKRVAAQLDGQQCLQVRPVGGVGGWAGGLGFQFNCLDPSKVAGGALTGLHVHSDSMMRLLCGQAARQAGSGLDAA